MESRKYRPQLEAHFEADRIPTCSTLSLGFALGHHFALQEDPLAHLEAHIETERAKQQVAKGDNDFCQKVKKGDKQPKEGDKRRRGCVTGDKSSCWEIAGKYTFLSKSNWC